MVKYGSSDSILVVDVQADLLSDYGSCVVLPLIPEPEATAEKSTKLKPVISVRGRNYILMTTDIGTIPRGSIKQRIANIEDEYRQDIVAALDFLFQGF